MSDGVLYKANASTWTKSVAKKMNATAVTDGVVKHADATTWYDNYPMEQLYDQYFNATWTKGYKADGTKLDLATWGDHPRSGDTADFVGMFGFDRTAMQNFVEAGIVQAIQIEIMFDDPSHAGNPIVNFFPHVYTSEPATWSGANANTNYTTQSTFNQTGYDFTRWIVMPVGAWLGGTMGGICVRAPSATGGNSARFAGRTTSHDLNGFNTRLWIQVLK